MVWERVGLVLDRDERCVKTSEMEENVGEKSVANRIEWNRALHSLLTRLQCRSALHPESMVPVM